MDTPGCRPTSLHELKLVVLAELVLAGQPERTAGVPIEKVLFDRVDADRYELGLHGLLDAVVALEQQLDQQLDQQ